ncbi:MAG: right-handed parallel beta-helix repeat-containing protein [Nanoarchaeota archaeon]|nr:right-handed parallel beta-helix repeat-containing protein [Nanoarchaeota archaeon]
MKRIILLIILFCVLTSSNILGDDCTIPTNGMNLTNSTTFCEGSYFLPGGIYIDMIEDNSVLDCNGAELIGNSTGFGINSISQNSSMRVYKNITIKNCIITNYTLGLWFWDLINSSVYNNNFVRNIIGMWADNISDSQTKNNIFNHNIFGLIIDGECIGCSKFSTIINNTFNGTQTYSGIYIGGEESFNLTELYDQNFFCIDCIDNYYYGQSDGPRCPDDCSNYSTHNKTVNDEYLNSRASGGGGIYTVYTIIPNSLPDTLDNIPEEEHKEEIENPIPDENIEEIPPPSTENKEIADLEIADAESIDEEDVSGLDAITGRFLLGGDKDSNLKLTTFLLIAMIIVITFIFIRRLRK